MATDRRQAIKKTVQAFHKVGSGSSLSHFILQTAIAADECPVWWSLRRDDYLSKFWPTEPFLAGAIYAVSTRNASFRWELTGNYDTIWRYQRMLNEADFGGGWQTFIMKVTNDLLTADNGAFIEVIRPARALTKEGVSYDAIKAIHPDTGEIQWIPFDRHSGKELYNLAQGADFKVIDSPGDFPVGISHLDSHRCTRTGDPLYPVLYTNLDGKVHKLTHWQVITLEDMPSPRKEMNSVGHCSVTRCLRLAQTLRDVGIYKHEKVSGRFARAIHITNADAIQLQDAIDIASASADSKGLTRYSQPVILSTVNPNSRPDVATINLASLPDDYSEEEMMRWYIAGLANALGVDYGFLAPLPGNKMGTSGQAETQAEQARGKSSRLFTEMLQNKFNYGGLFPRTVEFKFARSDPGEESARDRGQALRARTRSVMIKSGEIPPALARQISADQGDLDPKYLEMLGEADRTPMITIGNSDVKVPKTFTSKLDVDKLTNPWDSQNDAQSINEGGDGGTPGKINSNAKPDEEEDGN